jgi:hypothetical protein
MPVWVTKRIFSRCRKRQLGNSFAITREHGPEWLNLLELRILCGNHPELVERKHDLCVQRLLNPDGAILIEGGDAGHRGHRRYRVDSTHAGGDRRWAAQLRGDRDAEMSAPKRPLDLVPVDALFQPVTSWQRGTEVPTGWPVQK